MSLNDRTYGYEFAGYERNLLFDPDGKFKDTGFVRYANKQKGIFFLDPSLNFKTLKEEVYILKQGTEKPPADKLIEAVVSETEYKHVPVNPQKYCKITYKYVSGWNPVDPKKILGKSLLNPDDFLATLSVMMTGYEEVIDLRKGLGMYICSSPQLLDSEKGGIDTTVVGQSIAQKWTKFNQITKIIPTEFRQPSARVCYLSLETDSNSNPIGCCELNRAYRNIVTTPVQIPLPFTVEFKKYDKGSWESQATLARAFMIDAHMFQPEIPESMGKKVEDAMHVINEIVKYKYQLPYFQDIGSVVPKLTTSICRLNFGSEVTNDNLKDSIETWSDLVTETFKIGVARREVDGIYNLNDREIIMLSDIKHMKDTGMEMTVEVLKKNTKIWEWDFDLVLNGLKQKGHVYFPQLNKIALIER